MFLIKTSSNPNRWLLTCAWGTEFMTMFETRRQANIALSKVIRSFPNAEIVTVEVEVV